MKSFRNPKYLERYEDVVFDLEQPLETNPANNSYQTRTGLRFVTDNTREVTQFHWYNARLSVDFKVNLLANRGYIAAADHNGIVNGSNSFIQKLSILANGRKVYSCNYADHCVNIKNLLECNPSYAASVGTNEFYFLDTSRNAEERKLTSGNVRNTAGDGQTAALLTVVPNYSKGFAARKALLMGISATVNCKIRSC